MSLATTAFAIQRQLFPMLEEEIGPLSDKERRFVQVVELCHPQRFMSPFQWALIGRKPEDRLPLAKAFIAKWFRRSFRFPNPTSPRQFFVSLNHFASASYVSYFMF